MRKSDRMRVKLVAIILGVVCCIVVLLSGIRGIVHRMDQKEYISWEMAAGLMGALYEEIGITPMEADVKSEELTYEQYREMFDPIDRTKEYEQDDYKNRQKIPEQLFLKHYFRIIEQYSLEEVIRMEELFILADWTNAWSSDGEALPEGMLLTQSGVRKSSFIEESYLHRQISVVTQRDKLVAVLEENKEAKRISNVWILESGDDILQCFFQNVRFQLQCSSEAMAGAEAEQVSDLLFEEGKLSSVEVKKEKVIGKILLIKDNTIELEGYGVMELADEVAIYKLYGSMQNCRISDLKIGYDFTDFVIEDGKICAGLITRDEKMESIRVLLKGSNYAGNVHEKLELTADTDYRIVYGEKEELKKSGEMLEITSDSIYFEKNERIRITPEALTGKIALNSVHRNQGTPKYRGSVEILNTSEGLVVINEVLLEEYLYAVVPSEMPASYPIEALKAQAICARTYAYRNMENAGLSQYGAHVDDSTTYQVYNNILEQAETTRAVRETAGEILYVGEEPAGTYYYSTSCGYGTDATVWRSGSAEEITYLIPKNIGKTDQAFTPEEMSKEENFTAFIKTKQTGDYENGEGFYRWEYKVEQLDAALIEERLQARYGVRSSLILTLEGENFVEKSVEDIGNIQNMYVAKRNPGGVIDELIIEGSKCTIKVITEHNVRYVLNNTISPVIKQDGSQTQMPTLLPSAFFIIEPSKDGSDMIGYTLIGGGFGHGVGMSQNGAKNMAKTGEECNHILTFFYEGSKIKTVY